MEKVCVVTGAAGILCSSICHSLLEQGHKVALLGRTESKLLVLQEQLEEKYAKKTLVLAADVLDKEQLNEAYNKVIASWGRVDILVNGAGGNSPLATSKVEILEDDNLEDSFFGLKSEGFDQVFDLNFKGTLLACQVFAKSMLESKSGTIINVSSMSAFNPLTKVVAYSAAKAAVNNFTKWLAVHFAKSNITVNAIAPGFFVTSQNKFLLYEEDGTTLSARGQKIINNTPMNKFGHQDDIKSSIEFLANKSSRFVTGIVIPIDGGFSAFSGV